MNNIITLMKKQALKYYYFYALGFCMLLTIWLQLLSLTLYKNIVTVIPLGLLFFGIMSVSAAATLKHFKPKFKISNRLLLYFGLAVQLLCLIMLYKLVPNYYVWGALVFVLVSAVMSAFWLTMYFIDFPDLDIGKNKLVVQKVAKYFIVCAVLLYVPSGLLSRYYKHQINSILAASSVNVAGGLDYVQIEKILNEKMWQATGLELLFITLILYLFLFLYKKVNKTYE